MAAASKKEPDPIVYAWKPRSGIKVDPQLAGETVEMLREQLGGGTVSPSDLLNHAKASNSAIHDVFDWDDTTAAESWRIQQAGHLLRSLVVTVEIKKGESRSLRAFVNVTHRDQRGYTSLAHAMSDKELRAQVVDQAWQELLAWRNKYSDYSELAKVRSAIDAVAASRLSQAAA